MKMQSKRSRKKTSNKRAIFIDWNGTLSLSNFWGQLEKSPSKEDRQKFKLWADNMFISHKDLLVPWMKGAYTTEEILQIVSDDTKTKFDDLLEEFIIGCKKMEWTSSKIPSLTRQLREKSVHVSIATDNMDCFTRWTVPAMKLKNMFDDILNSFYLKAMKHELDENGKSLFFSDFFEKNHLKPSNCIFLDDGLDKMGVIGNLGIDYRQITPEKSLETELTRILQEI